MRITQSDTPPRLDVYVASLSGEISRAQAAKLIEQGGVEVNHEKVFKPGYKLKSKDKVKANMTALQPSAAQANSLPVIYEDEDCVVINKQVGVLSHSKGPYNPEATAATWLESKAPSMKGTRAGIVHRLDRMTSGVMVLAKTPEALSWLQKQFSQRKTKKTYVAIIAGKLANSEAIIDMPIERNPKKPQTFRVGVNGKSAQTAYSVLKTSDRYSWLELRPVTGRTHQLRVHLKQLGHPIVGDTLYGGEPASRLYLHAKSLELTLPNRKRQVFKAPVPKDFNKLIKV